MDEKDGNSIQGVDVQQKEVASKQELPSEKKIQDPVPRTFSNILKVKADPPGLSAEERTKKSKALAGAIAHGLRQYGEVQVRCVGHDSIAKGAKCIAIASGMVAVHGFDLYCRPGFISVENFGTHVNHDMTGISFLVVTSQMQSDVVKK